MQRQMSVRRRFLLILIACAVLPLVLVSMVGYRGLMTYDMTVQKYLTKTIVLLNQSSHESNIELRDELSYMEENLSNLAHQTKKILILSSVLSIAIVVAVGAFLVKSIAGEAESSAKAQPSHSATTDLSNQLEEMRKKLGNLIGDDDANE